MKKLFSFALIVAMSINSSLGGEIARLPNYTKTLSELIVIQQTGGPGGSENASVEVVTILGNPAAPGPYAQLLKVKANARIAPHHHAGDRVATVLSGTWYFGYGGKRSEAAMIKLSQGSVYTEPSNSAHYAETDAEPVVVLITGVGPTDTAYEEPTEDPRSGAR